MNVFRLIRDEKGDAALIGVMMAAAIGAVIMMTNAQMFTQMGRENRNAITTASALDTQRALEKLLESPTVCERNFDGQNQGGGVRTADIVDASGNVLYDVANPNALYENNSIRIVDWRISTPNPPVVMRNTPPAEMILDLNLTLEKVGDVSGPKQIQRTVKLVTTKVGATNSPIDTCYALVGTGSDLWVRDNTGTNIWNTTTGTVGVGTGRVATQKLEVVGNTLISGNETITGSSTVGGNSSVSGNSTVTGSATSGRVFTGAIGVNGPLPVNGVLGVTGNSLFSGNVTIAGVLRTANTTVDGTLTAGNINAGGSVSADRFCIAGNCRSTFAAQTCPPGQVIRQINAAGTVACSNPNCPGNTYYQGMDAGGNPICAALPTATCPVNQYISQINPMTGAVTCANIPPGVLVPSCPAGQYMTSITNGVPTCSAPAAAAITTSCPAGQVMTGLNNNAAVCTPMPAMTVVASSLGENGYIQYANGYTVQWGRYFMADNRIYTINYPVAFSQVFSVVLSGTNQSGGDAQINEGAVRTVGLASFTAVTARGNHNTWWMAYGMR